MSEHGILSPHERMTAARKRCVAQKWYYGFRYEDDLVRAFAAALSASANGVRIALWPMPFGRSSKPDILLHLGGELIVVEAKLNDMTSALRQLDRYSMSANRAYLLFDGMRGISDRVARSAHERGYGIIAGFPDEFVALTDGEYRHLRQGDTYFADDFMSVFTGSNRLSRGTQYRATEMLCAQEVPA